MLRVALFPSDQTGCGVYRMVLPAKAAVASGQVAAVFPETLPIRRRTRDFGRLEVTDANVDADVVVLQRPSHRSVVDAIPHLQRRGIAVVVDLDDDLAAPHPQAPIFAELHPSNDENNWHHLKRACGLADVVTVTTPALARRYGHRAIVLPNCVPIALLDITADRDGRTVGWGGNTWTHVNDLAATRGGVAQALNDTGARFLLVGRELDAAQQQLGLRDPPACTPPVTMAEYPAAIAGFDVGIVPLGQNAFNAAKSALKGLEYAALGIPFVASPVADYQRIHQQGIGLLAGPRAREWRRQVRALLTDETHRSEVAAQARQQVLEHHLSETNGWKWAEAWAEAVDRRRTAPRSVAA